MAGVMGGYLYKLAKFLEGLGLLIILAGVMMSVQLGMNDDTMKSMTSELYGLGIGAAIFGAGFLIERSLGAR
ncbi:MAG: hypothetical protein ACI8QC_000447 [Planctomycetota bacterium]|jgi:hypothetical protein